MSEDYLSRAKMNSSYSLRAYARDLGVSVSHLSKVLNRKKTFSLQTAEKILKTIGLWDEDPNFALRLISLDLSKSDDEREAHFLYLKAHVVGHGFVPDQSKEEVLKTLEHFLFYAFVLKYPSLKKLNTVSCLVGLNSENMGVAQKDLETKGYIQIDGDSVRVTDKSFFIESHKDLYLHHCNFSNFINQGILKKGYLDKPDSDGKGAILGLDSTTSKELKDHLDHFFRAVYRIANKSENPDRLVLITTSLLGWEV